MRQRWTAKGASAWGEGAGGAHRDDDVVDRLAGAWSLNRVDRPASSAQPSANHSSTTPVSAFWVTGTTGAETRTAATISPAALDRATMGPILLPAGAACGRVAGGHRVGLPWS